MHAVISFILILFSCYFDYNANYESLFLRSVDKTHILKTKQNLFDNTIEIKMANIDISGASWRNIMQLF